MRALSLGGTSRSVLLVKSSQQVLGIRIRIRIRVGVGVTVAAGCHAVCSLNTIRAHSAPPSPPHRASLAASLAACIRVWVRVQVTVTVISRAMRVISRAMRATSCY